MLVLQAKALETETKCVELRGVLIPARNSSEKADVDRGA